MGTFCRILITLALVVAGTTVGGFLGSWFGETHLGNKEPMIEMLFGFFVGFITALGLSVGILFRNSG